MSGHTPGPWGRVDGFFVEADTPTGTAVICNTRNDTSPYDECRANARLIAAAPDLLEALRPFAAFACGEPGDGCECHNCRARDVIAKATGSTP